MKYALCYLLLSYPIPVYEWMRPLRPTMRQVALDFQIVGPRENIEFVHFRNEVGYLRWCYRDLKGAPSLDETVLLPDLDECQYVVNFWSGRIKNLEAQRSLHGTYRYVDFDDAIGFAKEERLRWMNRAEAVNPHRAYRDRRLALKRLRDE